MERSYVHRRRVPRRLFQRSIGLLLRGEYFLAQSLEVGEGGMLVATNQKLQVNQLTVVTFHIPNSSILVIRGVVRYLREADKSIPYSRYGIQFEEITFEEKRHIRNFVAAKSEFEKLSV